MSNMEFNKVAAAVLVAGLVAMVAGNLADIFYKPNLHADKRGFKVDVSTTSSAQTQTEKQPEKIDLPALFAAAKAENGAQIAKKCVMCHTIDEGGHSKIGPNLWNVVGRKKAIEPDYNYSSAIQAKGGDWTPEDLFHMIHKPSTFIPGTKMTFAGLSNPQDVADVIKYLTTLSHAPIALPTK